jgi:uncharacterized paraquat-inducible protein A
MSQSISWLVAWVCWFTTGLLDPHIKMMGLSMLWWSRGGKLAEFAGGATLILDLIGIERLKTGLVQVRAH